MRRCNPACKGYWAASSCRALADFSECNLREAATVTLCRADCAAHRRAEETPRSGRQRAPNARLPYPCAPRTRMPRRWPRRCAPQASLRLCSNLQQRHRRRSLRLLHQSHPQPALVCVVRSPATSPPSSGPRGYLGVYHVLHGTLSPCTAWALDQLRTGTLVARVNAAKWTRSS